MTIALLHDRKTKQWVQKIPHIGTVLALIIAKIVAERTRNQFPVSDTGITKRSIYPKKERHYYTVGVRQKRAAQQGRHTLAYLGKLQKKYHYVQLMQRVVHNTEIQKIYTRLLEKIITEDAL